MKNAVLILFALAAPVSAAPQLEVDDVLAEARAALGWDLVARHPGAVRVRGAARTRGTDALQTVVFDGRGRRLQTLEGPLATSSGFDGETEWSVDWTGTARVMELGDRVSSEVAAAFLSGAWTAPHGSLEFGSVVEEGGALVLDFAHADGFLEGSVRLDAETRLPATASWTSGSSASQSVWTFSDYRDHDGYRFPAHVALSQSGLDQSLDTQEVEWLAEVDDALFAPRLGRPGDTRFDPDAPAALEVKQVPSGHLLVRPTIDGKELGWFIFDTGAGINCIANHVADELAEGPFGSIPAQGVGGIVLSRFWRAERMQLGPVTVDGPIFMGLDLEFLSAPFGVEVAGIIGYEFIARCVIELDVGEPSIALFDPEEYELPESGQWEEVVLYGRHPCVRAKMEGVEGVFKIDTGAAGDTVTLHYRAVADLELTKGRAVTAGSAGGVGGSVAVLSGEVESFVLGGHEFRKFQAEFATEDKGAFSDPYTWGNIGGKLLEPFLMVFDYPSKRIGFVLKETGE